MCGLMFWLCLPVLSVHAAELTGETIVEHCSNKYQGEDQRSSLAVTFKNDNGKTERMEFLRLWKEGGDDELLEKVLMITRFPVDQRNIRFMRWGYSLQSGRDAEQWIYLPDLRSIRRLSPRDPGDLEWGFTDEDLTIRPAAADQHSFKGINRMGNMQFYVVESTPEQYPSIYSKWVTWYRKTPGWEQCVPTEIHYYDKQGLVMKRVGIVWQQVDDAWLWEKAIVEDVTAGRTITYEVMDVEVNIGLKDRLFTERTLRRGYHP